jgi:hypothetical protein
MERGSNKHSARMDDALDSEVEGLMRSGHDNRADWNSPEPSGEDQPDVDLVPDGTLAGGVPDGMTEDDVEARSELATYLGKEVYPAVSAVLIETAAGNEAPDSVLARLRALPAGREYVNVQDVWSTLRGGTEAHRF